jgi:integral membrane protein
MNSPIGRFRIIGIIEGISYLVLLGIAMPLKYWAGIPEVVKVVGWAHGVLFVLYCLALLNVWVARRWSFGRAILAFVVSLLPFGTFIFDKSLRREEQGLPA